MKIRWHQSKDGFSGSECNGWAIYPMHYGKRAIQEYKLLRDNKGVGLHATQSKAKSAAQALENAKA